MSGYIKQGYSFYVYLLPFDPWVFHEPLTKPMQGQMGEPQGSMTDESALEDIGLQRSEILGWLRARESVKKMSENLQKQCEVNFETWMKEKSVIQPSLEGTQEENHHFPFRNTQLFFETKKLDDSGFTCSSTATLTVTNHLVNNPLSRCCCIRCHPTHFHLKDNGKRPP